MPFPHHDWPMPLIDSKEVDFTEEYGGKWTVAITDSARVGAGLYLAVPVMDEHEAAILEDAIREFRKGSADPTSPESRP